MQGKKTREAKGAESTLLDTVLGSSSSKLSKLNI